MEVNPIPLEYCVQLVLLTLAIESVLSSRVPSAKIVSSRLKYSGLIVLDKVEKHEDFYCYTRVLISDLHMMDGVRILVLRGHWLAQCSDETSHLTWVDGEVPLWNARVRQKGPRCHLDGVCRSFARIGWQATSEEMAREHIPVFFQRIK